MTEVLSNDVLAVQLMSDLHLEFHFKQHDGETVPGYEAYDITPVAPILALLGDIGVTVDDGLFSFLEKQLRGFERVLFVMGNHEGYNSSYNASRTRLQEFAVHVDSLRMANPNAHIGTFHFLDQTRIDLSPSVTILGCTLWSHIPPESAEIVGACINDFRQVENWSVRRYNEAHNADVQWLEVELSRLANEPARKVVILTHYSPVYDGTSDPRHKGSPINSGFSTEMSTNENIWKAPLVKAWAFGHTHYNCDFTKHGINIVSNQRGYDFNFEAGKNGFRDNFVLNI